MQTQETPTVYNGIQDELLKTKPVYDLLREFDGIEINTDGEIIKFRQWFDHVEDEDALDDIFQQIDTDRLHNIQIDIKELGKHPSLIEIDFNATGDICCLSLLKKLTIIHFSCSDVFGNIAALPSSIIHCDLGRTKVSGDIKTLDRLTNMSYANFDRTNVIGDIKFLALLKELTRIQFEYTEVEGDIKDLCGLNKLEEVYLTSTNVTGNVNDLQAMPNLKRLCCKLTDVCGDVEAFHEYRRTHGLKECEVFFYIKP